MGTCCNGFANGSGRDDEQKEPASEQQQNSNQEKQESQICSLGEGCWIQHSAAHHYWL